MVSLSLTPLCLYLGCFFLHRLAFLSFSGHVNPLSSFQAMPGTAFCSPGSLLCCHSTLSVASIGQIFPCARCNSNLFTCTDSLWGQYSIAQRWGTRGLWDKANVQWLYCCVAAQCTNFFPVCCSMDPLASLRQEPGLIHLFLCLK